MAPTIEPHWNMWETDSIHSGHVSIDCLLPTGIYIKLAIQSDATLQEIKMASLCYKLLTQISTSDFNLLILHDIV